jgi:nucleoside-diphosphate-sugar epimerase
MSYPAFIVTGGQGFIGSALIRDISQHYQVLGVTSRRPPRPLGCIPYEDLWAFDGFHNDHSFAPTHLIHCAALAHRAPPRTDDDYAALVSINIELSVRLAYFAKCLGVKRFIFLSSIGVHGSSTRSGESINEASPLCPSNPYSATKCEAEAELHRCLDGTSCELTIVRPSLVFGPGMPGNLRSLIRAIDAGIPFPLQCIHNSRSFVSLANLLSAIRHVALHPRAGREVYVVADAETISTVGLIRSVSRIRGKPSRLFPVPAKLVRASRHLPLIGGKIGQLVDDLVVDSTKIRHQLGWQQPFSLAEALDHSFARGS